MIESPYARGDVWSVDFGSDPADPEQAFVRPALIVSDDRLHHPNLRLVIVVPATTTIRSIPLHIVVDPDETNGLDHRSAFQVEQVRAVSSKRMVERLGQLGVEHRFALDEVLRNALGL